MASQFDNRSLQNYGLHWLLYLVLLFEVMPAFPELVSMLDLVFTLRVQKLLAFEFNVTKAHGLHWVVLDSVKLRHHTLNWLKQQLIGIIGESQSANTNSDANEDRLEHAERGLRLRC